MFFCFCFFHYLVLVFGLWFMVFNAPFNNISVISWQSDLLVEETRVHGENYQTAESHRQTLSHNVLLNTPHLRGIQTHNVSGLYSCYFLITIIFLLEGLICHGYQYMLLHSSNWAIPDLIVFYDYYPLEAIPYRKDTTLWDAGL